MPKQVYFILLSNEGDFLEMLDQDTWRATFRQDKMTTFDTKSQAEEYLFDMSIRSIWPQAKVMSTLV